MSAHTRAVFRAALTAAAAPVPYYETIGVPLDLNTAANKWVTLEFPQVTAQRTTVGLPACMRETGVAVVHVLVRSGQGDTELFDLVETIRPAFDVAYVQDVRMTGTQPAFLFPADDGEWLDAVFQIGYEWDYVA